MGEYQKYTHSISFIRPLGISVRSIFISLNVDRVCKDSSVHIDRLAFVRPSEYTDAMLTNYGLGEKNL